MPNRLSVSARCLALATLLTLLAGCATNWSESEKAKLVAVKVNGSVLAKNAYQKPDAKLSPGMANTIPIVTGGGLIPSLIGSAIDAGVMAKQQRQFEGTNAQFFEQLRATLADAPIADVDSALRRMFATDDFFGTRLSDQGTSTFSTEILYYGLANSPYSQKDDIKLRLRIGTKVTLKLADGRVMFEATIEGVASTAKRAGEILADPDFYRKSAREAASSLADQLQVMLEKKLQKPT